ncbi:hypothetical protein V8F20_005170 [Naviculisporaceae sp. PSN 640]
MFLTMMFLKQSIVYFSLFTSAIQANKASPGQQKQIPLNGHVNQPPEQYQIRADEKCTKSHYTSRYSMARSPWWSSKPPKIKFSAFRPHNERHSDSPISLPQIEPINATSSEQWEFDGVSSDGQQSFIFGFYRDPNYSFLGTGNLRVYFEMVGVDTGRDKLEEKRYAVVDYAESSLVEECGLVTRGVWKGGDFVYQFEISHDLRYARVMMQNPEVNVTVILNHQRRTSVLRHFGDPEYDEKDNSLMAVPHFYWVEPIPVARVDFTAVFRNRPQATVVAWSGMGGHERLWAAFNWYTCLAGMMAVRAQIGRYVVSYVEFSSGIQEGVAMQSVWLAEQGEDDELEDVFTVNRRGRIESSGKTKGSASAGTLEDHFTVRKLYAGDLKGATTDALADKVTGIEVVLESPQRGKNWKFVVEHLKVGFEYVLGEGVGGTGYSGLASGGLLGQHDEMKWKGPAFTEVMRFPKKSWLLNKNLNY